MTVELVNPVLGGVAAVIVALATFIKVVGPEYRAHKDWKRKDARRQRELSAISPTTRAITKRSA